MKKRTPKRRSFHLLPSDNADRSNKQSDYSVHEQSADKQWTNNFHVKRPDLGDFEGTRGFDFFYCVFGFPDVADVNAGKDTDERKHKGIAEHVEGVEEIEFTEDALRERNEYRQDKTCAYHYGDGNSAREFEFFAESGYVDLHEGDG